MCKFYGEKLSTQPNSTIPEGKFFKFYVEILSTQPNGKKQFLSLQQTAGEPEPRSANRQGVMKQSNLKLLASEATWEARNLRWQAGKYPSNKKPKLASWKITYLANG